MQEISTRTHIPPLAARRGARLAARIAVTDNDIEKEN
jgi:hypothetical protein